MRAPLPVPLLHKNMRICQYEHVATQVIARTPPAPPPVSARGIAAATDLLKALASAARLAIVLELAVGDRCVHELVASTGMTQPLVSQHLRVLRSSGVVTAQRRGRETAYTLHDEHIAHIAHDAYRHAQEAHA